MSETMDEFEQHELEYENVMSNLDAVGSLERSVLDSKKIDRMTMESLHRLVPETVDKNFPLVTFTTEPSEQNYGVALESFSVAKAVAIAAIGGILGAILMQVIKAFRSNKVDARAEYLDKKKADFKDSERDMKKILSRVKKLKLSTEDQIAVDAIEAMNVEFFMGKPKAANRAVESFVKEVTQGGKVYRILDRWSSDIANYTSEFKKRVRLLTEVVEVMYTVKGNDINSLKAKADEIVLNEKDRFIGDMTDLELYFQALDFGESFKNFIDEQVEGTQPFYDLATRQDTLTAYTNLYSNASVQIQKNLDEIEKKYAPVLQGSARDKAQKKAQAAARSSITSSDGEVRVSYDGAAGAINPMLLRSVRDAEESLRGEAARLRMYIIYLERVMFFYQKAALLREKVENTAMKRLMDIDNRAQ